MAPSCGNNFSANLPIRLLTTHLLLDALAFAQQIHRGQTSFHLANRIQETVLIALIHGLRIVKIRCIVHRTKSTQLRQGCKEMLLAVAYKLTDYPHHYPCYYRGLKRLSFQSGGGLESYWGIRRNCVAPWRIVWDQKVNHFRHPIPTSALISHPDTLPSFHVMDIVVLFTSRE